MVLSKRQQHLRKYEDHDHDCGSVKLSGNRPRVRIAWAKLLVLSCLIVACHRAVPVTSLPAKNIGPGPIVQDTGGVIAFFKDTGPVVNFPETRTFSLQTPGQRDCLRTALREERALWRASSPPDYRFLVHTGCFCPGVRGWLLMEVRRGQPLRAWDRTGRSAPLSDWDTFSIDGLFDMLERSADHDAAVQVSFDPRWHFPTYIRSEEHTSELQSRPHLVCRLLLEKKNRTYSKSESLSIMLE